MIEVVIVEGSRVEAVTTCPSVGAILDCRRWKRGVSGLDGAGSEPADEPPLEEQEQDEHRDGAEDAHRHHLVPLVGMLAHQELDADGDSPHVVSSGES